MEKITKLTPEQEQQLVKFREECLKIGLATGPSDRAETERVITEFYSRIGKEKPKFIFVRSPLEACGYIKKHNLSNNIGLIIKDKTSVRLQSVLWTNVCNNLCDIITTQIRDTLWWDLSLILWSGLNTPFYENLVDNLPEDLLEDTTYFHLWGAPGICWLSSLLFSHLYLRPMHTPEQMDLVNLWYSLFKSCFCWYPFEDTVVVSDRPIEINKDERTRLHNLIGPAIEFSDSYSLYKYHGVTLPKEYIEDHSRITVSVIEKSDNARVRRSLIELYGVEKYVKDSGATVISKDKYGTLWKKEALNDEPILFVEVVNSTPEPDGILKHYWLRVPPTIETAKEAVAWTLDIEPDNYKPIVES